MDGFRHTDLWCILIQEHQTQIQAIGGSGSDMGGVDPRYNKWIGPLQHGFPPYLPRSRSLAKTFILQHLDSSPVTRVADPALPTGTQRDQVQHRSQIIGGPPPLVGFRAKLEVGSSNLADFADSATPHMRKTSLLDLNNVNPSLNAAKHTLVQVFKKRGQFHLMPCTRKPRRFQSFPAKWSQHCRRAAPIASHNSLSSLHHGWLDHGWLGPWLAGPWLAGWTMAGWCSEDKPLWEAIGAARRQCWDHLAGKLSESPGNIIATYPFQVIAMEHIPSVPISYKGNTELLVWANWFTGFVIAQAKASRSAETVAEAYEEAVVRRFGESEAVRHDREPDFMTDFFEAFSKMMGQRQRATLAHLRRRPARLGCVHRTAHVRPDRTRDETPFYLVYGWDARSTLETTFSIVNTSHRDADARRWRMQIQRHYKMARAQALELVQEALAERATRHNEGASQHSIETGSQVWLHVDRVKSGYARKLAHMWHGPFRVVERVNAFAVRLETTGTPYQLFLIVHVSKLKPVREFPTRPATQLTVPTDGRFNFDEELLLEDIWNAQDL
ncbi:unnamed protein product [Phytophthora fragariaefolia]|uniref:Unnamed protein product n=1 Tax=Phytophthora fragariaefolia TaxID=1490495 RepID=A0A9W6TLR0_9STRA|nr:unnamed protein product [Phytophthora fragariaefolia]